jgi:hypothetical protein
MSTDSITRPSSSVWSAFSVIPSSVGRTAVATMVSTRNAPSIADRSPAGSVRISAADVAPPRHR